MSDVIERSLDFLGKTPLPNKIDSLGDVWVLRKIKGWKKLRKYSNKYGLSVQIKVNGRRRWFFVHRLVLLAFVGPPPQKCEGFHKDRNRENNVLENLEWRNRTEIRKMSPNSHYGKGFTDDQKLIYKKAFEDPSWRKGMSERTKKAWKDPVFVKKQMKSRDSSTPNKLEKKFQILSEENGWKFKFVGGGDLVIGGRVPDFVDENNNLVELYGDYWHKGDDPRDRIDYFISYGYKCLVIWESEFKTGNIVEKVNNFLDHSLVLN